MEKPLVEFFRLVGALPLGWVVISSVLYSLARICRSVGLVIEGRGWKSILQVLRR